MTTIDLGQLVNVTLVSDANTPPEYIQYNGVRLTLPGSVILPPPGEYFTMIGSGVVVHGSTRVVANGFEFVMTAAVDPDLAQVNAIPTGGWASAVARDGYLSNAKYLKGQGITTADLWPGLKNFYDWVVLDLQAKGWHA